MYMYVFSSLLLKKGCHFTWSSKQCEGLAICRAKEVHVYSFVSYIFKTLSISEAHNLQFCGQVFYQLSCCK